VAIDAGSEFIDGIGERHKTGIVLENKTENEVDKKTWPTSANSLAKMQINFTFSVQNTAACRVIVLLECRCALHFRLKREMID
jgi:hypothetical protein